MVKQSVTSALLNAKISRGINHHSTPANKPSLTGGDLSLEQV